MIVYISLFKIYFYILPYEHKNRIDEKMNQYSLC